MGRACIQRCESRVHVARLLWVWVPQNWFDAGWSYLPVSLLWAGHWPWPQRRTQYSGIGTTMPGFGL